MSKKIISFVCTVLLCAFCLTLTSFAENGKVSVSEKSITQGTTSVSVNIDVKGNPGIIFAKFKVIYPDEFSLKSVVDGGIWGNGNHSNVYVSPYMLYWNNGVAVSDFIANGTMATFNFEVPADIDVGYYPITIEQDIANTFNYDDQNVSFDVTDGGITVLEAAEGIVPETGIITVNNAVATAGDEVKVKIDVSNNPGLIYAKLKVTYPTELRLKGVVDGEIWGDYAHSDKLESPYTLYWKNGTATSDFTMNGTIATLIFDVSEDAETGDYPIELTVDRASTINYNDENVSFNVVNGAVTVLESVSEDIPNGGVVTIGNVSAHAGETVSFNVEVSDNPGLTYAKFAVTFPDKLTLKRVVDGGIWGKSTHSDNFKSPYTLYWNNATATKNYTANGTVARLTFDVPADMESGVYPISIAVNNSGTFNCNDENVSFKVVNGSLTVLSDVVEKQDEVEIKSFKILDSSYNELDSIPDESFSAEVTITNNSKEDAFTVMFSSYDENGVLLEVRYLYANPSQGQSISLGASISNAHGKTAKVKAMVFDSLKSFAPITESAQISK